MIKVPGTIRTYQVAANDFPVNIETKAKNLAFCQAVAGNTQVKKDGIVVGSIPISAIDDPANLAMHIAISIPIREPDLDLVQLISCTFPNNPPDNSRYEITITSATGDVQKTNGSSPTINPRDIILTFFYR